MVKTGSGLADFAISCLGHPYMYGVNGLVITEELIQQKRRQYPNNYSDAKIKILRSKIGQVAYQCNSFLSMYLNKERSANTWLSTAAQSGSIGSIPEIVGVSVHYSGHTGVYIGDGWVVEARGTSYGVVKTRLNDRPWKEWAMHSGIAYSTSTNGGTFMLKQGDKGPAVYNLQIGLSAMGASLGTYPDMVTGEPTGCDGSYGAKTTTAVKNLQAKHDLVPSGSVDEETFGVLVADILRASGNLFGELDKANAKIASALKTLNS